MDNKQIELYLKKFKTKEEIEEEMTALDYLFRDSKQNTKSYFELKFALEDKVRDL